VRLVAADSAHASADTLQRVGADYARQWRRAFSPRLHLAATVAHLAMKPWLAPVLWPPMARSPRLLTAIARGAGKAQIAPTPHGVAPLGEIRSPENVH